MEPGSRLGPYEILEPLGKGGMGEVYRARDPKLRRDVAIKVLPKELAEDPGRLDRLEREAHSLAALNHPNVATIHGLEEAETDDGGYARFLILELVEGETLEQRLERAGASGMAGGGMAGGGMPQEEALEIARQIAEGLEAAHDRGIVHRDLKPANVKITPDGLVKILDFGLAKPTDAVGAVSSTADEDDGLTRSPTRTVAGTEAGVLLGTAPYMSPEQVRAGTVDERTDVWAFGCVLYEMLTGTRPFEGETVSDVLAAILKEEPDWESLPAGVPAEVTRLLHRCLRKDPRHRLRHIGDARIVTEELLDGDLQPVPRDGRAVVTAASSRERLAWSLLAVATLVAAGLGAFVLRGSAPPPVSHHARFAVAPPEGRAFDGYPALSPDGRYLAFSATGGLWVRPLDGLEARLVPGTEGLDVEYPFWSPDGRSIGFVAGGELRRVDLEGGRVRTVCSVPAIFRGGTWNQEGVILFAREPAPDLFRVDAGGGVPQPVPGLTEPSEEAFAVWPQFLPDGRRFLFGIMSDEQGVWVGTLDSSDRELVVPGVRRARYDAAGYLLYVTESREDKTLVAQPFDAERLRTTGPLRRLAEGVPAPGPGTARFTTSGNGVLAFLPGVAERSARLTWLDENGSRLETVGPEGGWATPRISPDTARLAAVRYSGGARRIWVLDFEREVPVRVTSGGDESAPVWAPDGRRLAFSMASDTPPNLFIAPAHGGDEPRRLTRSRFVHVAADWSPDGDHIVYLSREPDGLTENLWRVAAHGGEPQPLIVSEARILPSPRISPDGDWIAYASEEMGQRQVYVTTFPEPGRRWQISTDGGSDPRWRGDSREIYYWDPEQGMMAVAVEVGERGASTSGDDAPAAPELSVELPRRLFGPEALEGSVLGGFGSYDVVPAGERFLFALVTGRSRLPVTVVTDWTALLEER